METLTLKEALGLTNRITSPLDVEGKPIKITRIDVVEYEGRQYAIVFFKMPKSRREEVLVIDTPLFIRDAKEYMDEIFFPLRAYIARNWLNDWKICPRQRHRAPRPK